MPIRAMGGRPRSVPPPVQQPPPTEIDEAAARSERWRDQSDDQLTELRKAVMARKSAFRDEHRHLRDRARQRLDTLAEGYQRQMDGILRARLGVLASVSEEPLTFSTAEVNAITWGNPTVVARWKELLENDASLPWSSLSLDAYREQLARFDEEVAEVDRELGLRQLRRVRMEAEAKEQAFAQR